MTIRPTATVKYSKTEMFISTPYLAEFVTAIKEQLETRRWNPKTKEWIVNKKERETALYLLQQFYEIDETNQLTEIEPVKTVELIPCFDNTDKLKPGVPINAWIDGACEPVNPGGTASYGLVIKQGDEVIVNNCGVVGSGNGMTNNVAEYSALIALFEWCKRSTSTARVRKKSLCFRVKGTSWLQK